LVVFFSQSRNNTRSLRHHIVVFQHKAEKAKQSTNQSRGGVCCGPSKSRLIRGMTPLIVASLRSVCTQAAIHQV
jgi:hypothetical protein